MPTKRCQTPDGFYPLGVFFIYLKGIIYNPVEMRFVEMPQQGIFGTVVCITGIIISGSFGFF